MENNINLLTIEDVSRILGVSIRTIRRYCKSEKLEYVKLDNGRLGFTQEELDRFMEEYYRI